MNQIKVYRVTKHGIQAIAKPAVMRLDAQAMDFESLELARMFFAIHQGFKPRVKVANKDVAAP